MESEIPIVRIGSTEAPLSARLQELWRYRELLYFLAWRDIKVRYRQALLGIVWALLQPTLMMILFVLVFGRLARMPSTGLPYALFAYAGLLPWMFFANAVSESGNSLIQNTDLITKVYVPRVLIPVAAAAASLLDFAIGFVLLIGLMIWYRVPLTPALIMLPVLLVLLTLFSLTVGTWIAALNVRYRDVRYVLPFAIQAWFFATPVIYPSSLVPQNWKPLLYLNPLSGIIEGCRSALFGRPFDWLALLLASAFTFSAQLVVFRHFRRIEHGFADTI